MFIDWKLRKQILVVALLLIFQTHIIEQVTAVDPISVSKNLPGQTWTFILLDNLTKNNIIDYDWISTLSVQGRDVTEEQSNYLQSLNLAERAAYFEGMGFTEGLFDNGRTTVNSEGNLFFVFYNPNVALANLEITLIYRSNAFSPKIIGIIAALVTIFILTIGILWAIRTRKKMNQKAIEREKTADEKYLEM